MRSTAGKGLLTMLLLAAGTLAACHSPAAGVAAPVPSETPSAQVTSAPATSAATLAPAPTRAKPTVSKAGLNYFFTVAIGAEYGDKSSVVTSWNWPVVSIRAHGGSAKSRSCLNKVISDFNALTATTDLRLTKGAADIELHFAPVSRFRALDPDYVKGNDGFFSVRWSDSYTITRASVLVRSSGISEGIRCHLIREELTQSMGMMRDSGRYKDSIFYSKYLPATNRYSALDKEVIRLMYGGVVRAGDDKKAITAKVTVKK
jgi:hypothetical protein